MATYYFDGNDESFAENCYNLKYWKDYMIENNIPEITLYEAKIEYNTDYMYCTFNHEVGDKGNCGKYNCDAYTPRNKVGGRCKYNNNCYEPTDNFKILKNKYYEYPE